MALYCGIDLHSRITWIAILTKELEVKQLKKVDSNLESVLSWSRY